ERDLAALATNLGDRFLAEGLSSTADDHLDPLAGQDRCRCLADAARATRDNRHLRVCHVGSPLLFAGIALVLIPTSRLCRPPNTRVQLRAPGARRRAARGLPLLRVPWGRSEGDRQLHPL